jgi:putative membrane protein
VQQQGRDLAQKLNVMPTPPADTSMMAAHHTAMASLEGKSGADFDRAFLENEVAYHQAVIDAVNNTLMPAIKNQELKDLVTKVAPAFVAHKQAAQNLLDKMPKA